MRRLREAIDDEKKATEEYLGLGSLVLLFFGEEEASKTLFQISRDEAEHRITLMKILDRIKPR